MVDDPDTATRIARPRVAYLDSLRGFGAVAVAFSHFSITYFSFVTTDTFGASVLQNYVLLSPAMFLIDGDSAVCMFFVLSGYVLTPAFKSYVRFPGIALAARFIRLFVPAICACTFGYILYFVGKDFAIGRHDFLTLDWSLMQENGRGSLLSFIKDALLNAPLLGYRGETVFDYVPGISKYLSLTQQTYNAPLWTLSIEAQGSILIFILTSIHVRSLYIWRFVIAFCLVFFIRYWFVCFIAGHLVAIHANTRNRRADGKPLHGSIRLSLGLTLIALGIFILLRNSGGYIFPFDRLRDAKLPFIRCDDPEMIGRLYGCIAVFIGLYMVPRFQRILEMRPLLWLGRMSFPIYLVHWPIIIFISPFIAASLATWISGPARIVFIGVCTAFLVLIAALIMFRVDQFTIVLGKRIRRSVSK